MSAAVRVPGALLRRLGAGVVLLLAAVLAAGPVEGGLAAWGTSAQRASAPFTHARVGHTFTPGQEEGRGATHTGVRCSACSGAWCRWTW